MAFRLDLDKKPAAAARRTLAKRLAKAAEREHGEDVPTAVHDARKDLKKSRSLLRLLRPALDDDLYDREMTDLRQVARALSSARDAEVLPVTLAELREHYPNEVPEAACRELEARLAKDADVTEGSRSLADQSAALEAASQRVREWPLAELSWGDITARLGDSFRRGRKAMRSARWQPSDENLHEWRKRVKDLLYQLGLLEAAWPTVVRAYAGESHRLADLLGDDHDLAVLRFRLGEGAGPWEGISTPLRQQLDALAERRRVELQAEAWLLGERIYGEAPRALEQRIDRLVRTARSHSDRGGSYEHL
jgi:CHAD domain-containing protein